MEVITQVVAGGYQKSYQKPNMYQKSTNPFISITTKAAGKSKYKSIRQAVSWPPPQVTPGADGSLNPAFSCKYCKDIGHDMSNCTKIKRKETLKAAAASQQSNNPNKGN